MITQTMTSDEVIRGLQANQEYIVERMNGLGAKNSKKLKNKFIKDNDIMSKSTYVVPETKDTVVVFAIKRILMVKGKEHSTMTVSHYLKTYYNTYIVPVIDAMTNRVLGYIEFTCHSVERIRQRLGKDFDTFFQQDFVKNNGAIQALEYKRNLDPNERIAHIGDAFAIMEYEDSERRYVVKTILSEKELYANQMTNKMNSKRDGEAIGKRMSEQMAEKSEANYKEWKRMGIIRSVA